MGVVYLAVKVCVSPAHAGIDRAGAEWSLRRLRFPRPRGDRPGYGDAGVSLARFPPPTRG